MPASQSASQSKTNPSSDLLTSSPFDIFFGDLVLYTADRAKGMVERRIMKENGGQITGATLAGLGGTGQTIVDPGGSLRNVRVDRCGRVWTTALTRAACTG